MVPVCICVMLNDIFVNCNTILKFLKAFTRTPTK